MDYQITLDWPDFFQRHWQKHPLLLKRGFEHFKDPISADELAGLAMESHIDSRLFCHRQGKWQMTRGPFDCYSHLGESNWTLLVQSVNHWNDPCAALMNAFRTLPDWRVDDLMVSFSTPGGGVGPHIDQYDVFIIQGSGRRRWRVGEKYDLPQHSSYSSLLRIDSFDAIIDEELEAGDVLYIPPGFPHEGWSLENALNYSVGFRAPSGCELINSFADFIIQHELGNQLYQDPNLVMRIHPAEILPHELAAIQAAILQIIQQPEHFRQWFGEFISQSRYELDIAPADPPWKAGDVYDALCEKGRLTRINGLRVLIIDETLFVNGSLIVSQQRLALRALAGNLTVTSSELGGALNDPTFLTQLTDLINEGYWFFSDT